MRTTSKISLNDAKYTNVQPGNTKLKYRYGTNATQTGAYGLTSDISASQYSPVIKVNGSKLYIASQSTRSRSTTSNNWSNSVGYASTTRTQPGYTISQSRTTTGTSDWATKGAYSSSLSYQYEVFTRGYYATFTQDVSIFRTEDIDQVDADGNFVGDDKIKIIAKNSNTTAYTYTWVYTYAQTKSMTTYSTAYPSNPFYYTTASAQYGTRTISFTKGQTYYRKSQYYDEQASEETGTGTIDSMFGLTYFSGTVTFTKLNYVAKYRSYASGTAGAGVRYNAVRYFSATAFQPAATVTPYIGQITSTVTAEYLTSNKVLTYETINNCNV